jgi:hypothetical protein
LSSKKIRSSKKSGKGTKKKSLKNIPKPKPIAIDPQITQNIAKALEIPESTVNIVLQVFELTEEDIVEEVNKNEGKYNLTILDPTHRVAFIAPKSRQSLHLFDLHTVTFSFQDYLDKINWDRLLDPPEKWVKELAPYGLDYISVQEETDTYYRFEDLWRVLKSIHEAFSTKEGFSFENDVIIEVSDSNPLQIKVYSRDINDEFMNEFKFMVAPVVLEEDTTPDILKRSMSLRDLVSFSLPWKMAEIKAHQVQEMHHSTQGMIRSKRYPDTLKERVLFFDEVQDKLDQYVADLMEMYDPKVKGLLAQAKEDGYWQELPRIEWMNDIFNSVKRESKRKNMKKEMIEDIFQSVYQENREFYYYTRRKNKELQSSLLSNLYEELNPILEDLDKSGYTKEVKEKISGLKKKTDDLKWGIF